MARAADPAAAQALFDDAKQLVDQRRFAEACPKFAESQRLDPGLGTEFHLADCWQRIGLNASAWALFRQVESEAGATGQEGRARVAHDRASAIESLLSRIQIDPNAAASTPGLAITRDGAVVSRELWGVPVPVDPGPHIVAVRAPDKQPWEVRVDITPNANVAHVEVPLLADLAPPPPPLQPPPGVAFAPPPPVGAGVIAQPPPRMGVTQYMPTSQETAVVQDRGGTMRAFGWFFVGAGVVGLAASAYFGAQWIDDHESTNPSFHNDTDKQRSYAVACLAAGGGSLLLGTILVAAAPGPRLVMTTTAAHVDVAPMLGPRVGGLSLHGAW
jgi:hypothetical protein